MTTIHEAFLAISYRLVLIEMTQNWPHCVEARSVTTPNGFAELTQWCIEHVEGLYQVQWAGEIAVVGLEHSNSAF